MFFKKFDYLNLLPFSVFIKQQPYSIQLKKEMEHKGNVPSQVNKLYHNRKLNSAFISSITAKRENHSNIGIVAQREVLSVLATPPYDKLIEDSASQTSNELAKVLNVKGQIIIGDNALRYYLKSSEYIDLAYEWKSKMKLPFVFAVLCYHNRDKNLDRLIEKFRRAKVKIPRYILDKEAKRKMVKPTDILYYLKYISYKINYKEQRALKKFYSLSSKR